MSEPLTAEELAELANDPQCRHCKHRNVFHWPSDTGGSSCTVTGCDCFGFDEAKTAPGIEFKPLPLSAKDAEWLETREHAKAEVLRAFMPIPRPQRGCAGKHHGIGTPDCPRELHHHHDEHCAAPPDTGTR